MHGMQSAVCRERMRAITGRLRRVNTAESLSGYLRAGLLVGIRLERDGPNAHLEYLGISGCCGGIEGRGVWPLWTTFRCEGQWQLPHGGMTQAQPTPTPALRSTAARPLARSLLAVARFVDFTLCWSSSQQHKSSPSRRPRWPRSPDKAVQLHPWSTRYEAPHSTACTIPASPQHTGVPAGPVPT
jgi:hypothetical protein